MPSSRGRAPRRGTGALTAVADVLVRDDPLYDELYDIRREAEEMGNLVEVDVNPLFAAARARGPVQAGTAREIVGLPVFKRYQTSKDRPNYAVFGYDACEAAFRDSARFSSRISHHPNPANEQQQGILEMDGRRHLAYRATLQSMFIRPRTLTWWRQRWIDDIVEALIGRLRGRDRAELNLDYCARVPVHTVTRAIGMEGDDALVFRGALTMMTEGGRRVTAEQRGEAAATVWRMLDELIERRRAVPGDDVVSKLIDQTIKLPDGTERPLTNREIAVNSRLVMIAGGGTSWRQFGIALWALLTHRDQLDALKADRGLMDRAIEESVRWNVTATLFNRITTEDVDLGGVTIPADSVVDLVTGAANRDPARWDRPDDYDLHRPAKPHLGFAIGQHQCLGANVARSELAVGIGRLLDEFPHVRLDPDAPAPFLTGGLEQRGLSALHVRLR